MMASTRRGRRRVDDEDEEEDDWAAAATALAAARIDSPPGTSASAVPAAVPVAAAPPPKAAPPVAGVDAGVTKRPAPQSQATRPATTVVVPRLTVCPVCRLDVASLPQHMESAHGGAGPADAAAKRSSFAWLESARSFVLSPVTELARDWSSRQLRPPETQEDAQQAAATVTRAHWQPDSATDACSNPTCRKPFAGLLVRRHHCRWYVRCTGTGGHTHTRAYGET
jgi:hypothetical protein